MHRSGSAEQLREVRTAAAVEEEKKQDGAHVPAPIDSAASASPRPSSISVPTDEPTALVPDVMKDTGRYGCDHGARLCKVRGICCTSFYTCRICHDRNANHQLLRRDIVDMVCMYCADKNGAARVQPVSNQCVDCHQIMAKHFCEVCRGFSDNSPDEGFFFHCTSCEEDGDESGVGYCVADSKCPHGRPNADERAKKEKEKQKQDKAKMKKATRAMKKSEEQHAKKTNATKLADQPKPADPVAPADAAASSDASAAPAQPRLRVRSPFHPHPLYVLVPFCKSAQSDETPEAPPERCSDCNIELDTHARAMCERDECKYGICVNCIEQQLRDIGRNHAITIQQFVLTPPYGEWTQQWVDGGHTFKLMTIDTTKPVPDSAASESMPINGRPSCDMDLNGTIWLDECVKSVKRLSRDLLTDMHRLACRMSQLPWKIEFGRANKREGFTPEVVQEREKLQQKIIEIPSALRVYLPSNDGTPPPPDLYLPKEHKHPLQFFASRYQGVYECNLCHTNSSEGAYAYACNQCNYNAHLSCIIPHNMTSNLVTPSLRDAAVELTAPLTTPLHRHHLESVAQGWKRGDCKVCGQFGDGASFACNECSWDAHLACVLYPKLAELCKADISSGRLKTMAVTDWRRIENNLQAIFLLAHRLRFDQDQKVTIGAQQAAFIESKYIWNETEVQWRCSRVECTSNVADRSTIDAMAVYRCTDCCTNLCLECAAAMHAQGHVRIVNDGSEVDANQVKQWCLGDGVTPAIQIDDINAVLDSDKRTGLMIAIERRDLKQAVWLLQLGSEVHRKDADGRNALHYAVLTADPQLVQLVLKHQSQSSFLNCKTAEDDPNTRPLGIAAAAGNLPIVRLLVQAEAVLEGNLWLAVANGHVEVTRFLLRSGAPIDDEGCDSKGITSTALHQACRVGSIEMVQLLLSYGADVRIEDDESHTCLFQAVTCKHERPDILAALLLHFKQPAQKSKTRQVQLKHTTPFKSQKQESQVDEHVRELVKRTGYGSHLQCMMPYCTSLVADACKTRTYPSLMHEAACRGHITCVDVILREIAKSIYSKSAAAPGTNARVWTAKEVSNAVAAQESISSVATVVGKGQRFQFEHLYSKSRSQIMNHAPVLMLLQYPHIHYALDGGADALMMVAFSLDYLGCFPSVSSERCEGPPASVCDRVVSNTVTSLYGFTTLHAACASKTCTRALVQMLLLRGASPITIPETRRANLNTRTPLGLLLRNQDIPLSEKLEICHDLALVVARMYENTREIDVKSLSASDRTACRETRRLLRLFAKQLSSDERTVSTAWRTIGTMWGLFVPGCIRSAPAEQILSLITDQRISPVLQRQLLFDSQLSRPIVMSLLPLLAEQRQLTLLGMLAGNESTKFVHTNSIPDHLSMVSVLSCASSVEGVKAILTRLPSPALTNTCDALGRAPIKIALQAWMGIHGAATAHAQAFTRRAAQQYQQSRSRSAGMRSDQLDEFLAIHRDSLLADLSTLPIATLNALHTEYEEMKMIVNGQKSADLLAHTPHALNFEWGQTMRFDLGPKAPPKVCPVRFCAKPIIAYCPMCARYLCSACSKAVHTRLASPHVMIPIDDLKEAYLPRFRALDLMLRATRDVTTITAAGGRQLAPTANQQSRRHNVLRLLLSAAGKFDAQDVADAVRHCSIDLLNFRTRPFKLEEKYIEKARQLRGVKDAAMQVAAVSSDAASPSPKPEFSSALVGNRSVLHLAAVQQNPGLIDSLMHLFLRPKPTMKLMNAHRPFRCWQLLLWGDVQVGLRINGVRFYHHDTQIHAECTDAAGERVVFPYTDSSESSSFRASDGQSLLYFTYPYPLLLTHYELVIDPVADPQLAPLQWQLAASNGDNAALRRRDTRWSVVRRHTAAELTFAEAQPQSDRGPSANQPQPAEVTIRSALSDLLPMVNHVPSSHHTSDAVGSTFLYYRWLFTATLDQAFQLRLDSIRFFHCGQQLEPSESGQSHGMERSHEDVSHGPIALHTVDQNGSRKLAVLGPYPEDGGRTRAIVLYKFAQPVKLTDYTLIAPSDVNKAPNSWRLYATNAPAVAENYMWTPEVDESSPQDQPWVLLDEKDDVPYPTPNSHIVDVSLLCREKDGASGSSSLGGADSVAAATAASGTYQYFRLDFYSIFRDDSTSICLQEAELRDASGGIVTPTRWRNPHGQRYPLLRQFRSDPRNLRNLSHPDSDACWTDMSIGSIGTSELIACFDKPVQLHSYQFARRLGNQYLQPPRAWTLAGSNDKQHWQTIHTMTDEKGSELWKMTAAELELKEEAAAEVELHKMLRALWSRTLALSVTGHEHPLSLHSYRFPPQCNVCGDSIDTFGLSCKECAFHAHPHCAWNNRALDAPKKATLTLTEEEFDEKMRLLQAKQDEVKARRVKQLILRGTKFKTTEHACVLKLFTTFERPGVACKICKKSADGSGLTFACEQHDWNVHPACAWTHRDVKVVADDTMTKEEFNAALGRKRAEPHRKRMETHRVWSNMVFIHEHAIEAKSSQSPGNAVAHALGSTVQASTGGLSLAQSDSTKEAAPNPWLQRLFPDGTVGTPVMQASTEGLIVPTSAAADEWQGDRLVSSSSSALIRRVRGLFNRDGADLTPRDYALTPAVSRTLRKWERVLGLSPIGVDAIIVFDQPQLIDSDVFEQFVRSMGSRAWNALTCSRKDVLADSKKKKKQMQERMCRLKDDLEKIGLTAHSYDSSETSHLAQVKKKTDSTAATAVLLVTAPYARLLLECFSRELQDDPQYKSHRLLASDWCLPADMQEALISARTPFTTVQRQALVMRILSGLGTDIDALGMLQHYKPKQDAVKLKADATAATDSDNTKSRRPTLPAGEARSMAAAEEGGKNRCAACTDSVRRLGASLKSAVIRLAKKVKCGKATEAEEATIVLHSDVIGQANVNRD